MIPEVYNIRATKGTLNPISLLLIDIFRAHQDQESLQILKDHNIQVIFISPNLTSLLQPNDQLVNRVLKNRLQREYQEYYTKEFLREMKCGTPLSEIRIDTRLSVIKTRQAARVVAAFLSVSKDIILKSWRIAGLFADVVEDNGDPILLSDESFDLSDTFELIVCFLLIDWQCCHY